MDEEGTLFTFRVFTKYNLQFTNYNLHIYFLSALNAINCTNL